MDVLSYKLLLPERRMELVMRDAAGERQETLEGASYERVLAAAELLLARLAQDGDGPLQHLSVDAATERLLYTCLRQRPGGPSLSDERTLIRQHGANMGEVGEVPPHLSAVVLTGADYRHHLSLLRDIARVASRAVNPRRQDPAGLDEAASWEHKYHSGGDGWELMRTAPPLERWLAAHPPRPGAQVLVVGCGRGHEARALGRAGAQVVAIDLAGGAVEQALRLVESEGLEDRVSVRQQDLFDLQEREAYDLVLEHCCFCAIEPARRDEYVRVMHGALRPGGHLLGLFWCHPFEGGPPYGSTRQEIVDRFGALFETEHEEVPADSILTRAQHELLLLLRRR